MEFIEKQPVLLD